jgi:putative ABC transport system substrate-binding protein
MKRRKLIVALTATAIGWREAARAQTRAVPIVGTLSVRSASDSPEFMVAFRRALAEGGFVDGQNIVVEERWANNNPPSMPALAAELVRLRPTVIFTSGGILSARVAQAATSTIPVVFAAGSDPVAGGLVASLARPGGNLTGITFLSTALAGKRLELLREAVADARIAAIVDPTSPTSQNEARELEDVSTTSGQPIHRLDASTPAAIDDAFATLARQSASALIVTTDVFLGDQRERVVALAKQYRIPVISFERDFAEAGGLMSYGSRVEDAYRLCAGYVVRILKGDKPADLPVMQPTRFELVVNLQTARTIGVTIPQSILLRADEVIE